MAIAYHDQPADLCVEVMPPSNTKKGMRAKIEEYFFAGVRVVDPETRSVEIFRAPGEGHALYDDATLDGGGVLPGFARTVSDLFA